MRGLLAPVQSCLGKPRRVLPPGSSSCSQPGSQSYTAPANKKHLPGLCRKPGEQAHSPDGHPHPTFVLQGEDEGGGEGRRHISLPSPLPAHAGQHRGFGHRLRCLVQAFVGLRPKTVTGRDPALSCKEQPDVLHSPSSPAQSFICRGSFGDLTVKPPETHSAEAEVRNSKGLAPSVCPLHHHSFKKSSGIK